MSSGELFSIQSQQSGLKSASNSQALDPRSISSNGSTVKETEKNKTEAEEARKQLAERKPEDPERSKVLAETLNKVLGFLNRDIKFNALPEHDVFQAEIINSKTKDVIKRIPRNDVIKLREKMDLMIGMMIDELR